MSVPAYMTSTQHQLAHHAQPHLFLSQATTGYCKGPMLLIKNRRGKDKGRGRDKHWPSPTPCLLTSTIPLTITFWITSQMLSQFYLALHHYDNIIITSLHHIIMVSLLHLVDMRTRGTRRIPPEKPEP